MTMKRILSLAYGALAYTCFLGTIVYAIGFVGNMMVPKSIDTGASAGTAEAILVNMALLSLFAVQHSGMARPGFKKMWTRIIPQPIERSTFVLATCVVFGMLFWQWRPLPEVVWQVEDPLGAAALTAISLGGWMMVVLATFMIHHFDLFGLRQVYLHFRGYNYRELGFRAPGFYRYMRHPIMAGFLIAFWVTPVMTMGHLLFAAVTTGYILVAIQLEERDLMRFFGDRYRLYRDQVPALLPRLAGYQDQRWQTPEIQAGADRMAAAARSLSVTQPGMR